MQIGTATLALNGDAGKITKTKEQRSRRPSTPLLFFDTPQTKNICTILHGIYTAKVAV